MTELDHIFANAIAQGVFSGAACGFASDLGIQDTHYWGRHSFEALSHPVSPSSLFDLASLTKILGTTFLVAYLMDHHGLDLCMPVGSQVQGVEVKAPLAKLRIFDLLTHQSGLRAWLPLTAETGLDPLAWGSDLAKRAALKHLVQEPLLSLPGEKVVYSDVGFLLLNFWLEDYLGVGIDEATTRLYRALHVPYPITFRPLSHGRLPSEMVATELRHLRARSPLSGEVHDDNAALLGGVSTHAGLFATLQACLWLGAMWLRSWLRPGGFISQKTCERLAERHVARDGSERAVGFDVKTGQPSQAGDLISRESVGHLGYTGTSLWIDKARRGVVVLLSNRVHPQDTHLEEMKRIRHDVADYYWRQSS